MLPAASAGRKIARHEGQARVVQVDGLDLSEIPAAPYPEGIPATAVAPRFVSLNGGGTTPVGTYNAPQA